jgi:hypothetical protein
MRRKPVEFKCSENDNLIRYVRNDGEESGEFWFALPLKKKEWIVIGESDLVKFMHQLRVVESSLSPQQATTMHAPIGDGVECVRCKEREDEGR